MTTYKYFQPEYVSKFKCDGQACSARCCRNWNISIDKKTYKKYSHLKPKSVAREITRQITTNDELKSYSIKLDENKNCPFLTEDNLCGIRLKYGKDFLSESCATYPQVTWHIEDFYENSLTLTCPVAANLILLSKEPMKFEKIEVPKKLHKSVIPQNLLPENIRKCFLTIQETQIKILQERSLTIDQRLLMLGLYFDKIDELFRNERTVDFEKLSPIYQSQSFLQEQSAQFSAVLTFNAHEHMRIMLDIFEKLYSDENAKMSADRKFLDDVINALKIKLDENNTVKISSVAENYLALGEERQKILSRFGTIFENYLVNELFVNLYPFRFNDRTFLNYGVFVTIYKMLELFTLSISIANEQLDESELVKIIGWHVNNTEHNLKYIKIIQEHFEDKENLLEIMQSMLQF